MIHLLGHSLPTVSRFLTEGLPPASRRKRRPSLELRGTVFRPCHNGGDLGAGGNQPGGGRSASAFYSSKLRASVAARSLACCLAAATAGSWWLRRSANRSSQLQGASPFPRQAVR